jgi:glycosyltransferase involved in cell wall biosynthesis
VLREVRAHGLEGVVEVPGFVATEVVEDAIARALCLLLPSRREGYGLVVVEAAASGTPSVVVAGPDNAAVELVTDGRNGYVAPSADPDALAEAIVRIHEAGPALRRSTEAWFESNVERFSLEHSLQIVLGVYASERSARS